MGYLFLLVFFTIGETASAQVTHQSDGKTTENGSEQFQLEERLLQSLTGTLRSCKLSENAEPTEVGYIAFHLQRLFLQKLANRFPAHPPGKQGNLDLATQALQPDLLALRAYEVERAKKVKALIRKIENIQENLPSDLIPHWQKFLATQSSPAAGTGIVKKEGKSYRDLTAGPRAFRQVYDSFIFRKLEALEGASAHVKQLLAEQQSQLQPLSQEITALEKQREELGRKFTMVPEGAEKVRIQEEIEALVEKIDQKSQVSDSIVERGSGLVVSLLESGVSDSYLRIARKRGDSAFKIATEVQAFEKSDPTLRKMRELKREIEAIITEADTYSPLPGVGETEFPLPEALAFMRAQDLLRAPDQPYRAVLVTNGTVRSLLWVKLNTTPKETVPLFSSVSLPADTDLDATPTLRQIAQRFPAGTRVTQLLYLHCPGLEASHQSPLREYHQQAYIEALRRERVVFDSPTWPLFEVRHLLSE